MNLFSKRPARPVRSAARRASACLMEAVENRTLMSVAAPVTYQAEDASFAGAVFANNQPGYTGRGFVDYVHTGGDYVDFAVNAPEAGTYALDFRYANGDPFSSVITELLVNGEPVTGGQEFPPTASSPSSSPAWQTATSKAVTLAAGTNHVRLRSYDFGGPDLDAMTLRELAPLDGYYLEAERARLSGVNVANNNAGYTGTGFADYVNLKNDYVEFTVNVDAAHEGVFQMGLRYANGTSANRRLAGTIDGRPFLRDPSFGTTRAWDQWATYPVDGEFTLTAGTHTIRLTDVGQSGPNLDAMILTRVNNLPPFGARVEAEDATRSGVTVGRELSGWSGSGYADYQNLSGDFVEFVVNLARPEDNLSLGFRYANGSRQDRPLQVKVDGAVVADRLSFAPTGSWDSWSGAGIGRPLSLSAGRHTIRLTDVGASGPNLDYMALSQFPVTPPPPPPAPAPVYEAESARLSGAVVARNVGGYTGSGFADYVNLSNDFVEFAPTVSSGGTYRLDFRYANGANTSRQMALSIDGNTIAGGIQFGPLGSWSTWGTTGVEFALAAGTHTVRLTATGQSGPNLDNLKLTRLA